MTADGATQVCCGEKRCGENRPETAGLPLIPACQLCPKSATYWRRAGSERLVDAREEVTS